MALYKFSTIPIFGWHLKYTQISNIPFFLICLPVHFSSTWSNDKCGKFPFAFRFGSVQKLYSYHFSNAKVSLFERVINIFKMKSFVKHLHEFYSETILYTRFSENFSSAIYFIFVGSMFFHLSFSRSFFDSFHTEKCQSTGVFALKGFTSSEDKRK